MREKRKQARRDATRADSPPLIDRAGNPVPEERRRVADRRLNNVWLELVRSRPGEVPADWGRKMRRCIREAGLS